MGEGWKLPGKAVPVVHVDVTEEQAKRLNLALNKITGQPNLDKLGALLKELHDISGPEELAATGYSPHEIDDLLELLETDQEALYQSIPDHEAGKEDGEGWIDLSFRLSGPAAELVRDELKRLKRLCGFKTQNADGLALEKMAVLSSLTPKQSVQ
jgi:ParB-like chromosome segregation protein Spo0J